MLWNDFIRLNHVYKLPLNEQLRRFKEYIIYEEEQVAGQHTASTPVPTFNFIFNQQNETGGTTTISSISGFTSTPAFTSISGLFTFNSTGTPAGLITFRFVASITNQTFLSADLSVNEGLPEQLGLSVLGPTIFAFTPITVSQNDTVEIRTYDAG
jgi:hypothetical protein